MLGLLQLLLAVFAIYSALKFPEELKLFIPLGCLVAMLVVSRIEKESLRRKPQGRVFCDPKSTRQRRKNLQRSEIRIFPPSSHCSGQKVNCY